MVEVAWHLPIGRNEYMPESRFELFAVDAQSNLRSTFSNGGNYPAGVGWGDFRKLVYGGHGVLYGLHKNGSLYWYRRGWNLPPHDGWDSSQLTNTWGDMRLVTCAGGGVIFAVHNNGNLYRFHHTGWRTGANEWADWNPPPVGGGWQGMKEIAACLGDFLYAIDSNGDLKFYHITSTGGILTNGAPAGGGWGGFKDVFASGDIICGVHSDAIHKYQIPTSGGAAGGIGSFPTPDPMWKHWAGGWIVAPYLQPGSYWLRTDKGYRYENNTGHHNVPAFTWGRTAAEWTIAEIVFARNEPERKFEVIVLSDPGPNATFALRAPNGKYVCSEADGRVTCDRDVRSTWETFTLEGMAPGGAPSLSEAEQASNYRCFIKDWKGRFMIVSTTYAPFTGNFANAECIAIDGKPADHDLWKYCFRLFR